VCVCGFSFQKSNVYIFRGNNENSSDQEGECRDITQREHANDDRWVWKREEEEDVMSPFHVCRMGSPLFRFIPFFFVNGSL
jgi:hypothetical protein